MNSMELDVPAPLRIAVVGGGAFGRNHLRVYSELAATSPAITLSALVDSDPGRRAELAATLGIPAFASTTELLSSGPPVDAASVCVPTLAHASVAVELLSAGLDVLIEKPITATLAEADALIALAARLDRIIAVGHLERFNPAVSACFSRLTSPRFFEAHRLSIFTPRSLDIDVVLDLMIHDLDIVLALCASGIREVRAVGLPVLSPQVDIANVRVEFNSGCIANFTASRVSTERVRKLRLFQPEQYLSLDFARQELLSIEVKPGARPHLLHPEPGEMASSSPGAGSSPQSAAPLSTHPSPGLSMEKVELCPAEPLRLELQDFLRAVRTRTAPRVTAQAGRAALALALEITREITIHAKRAGLSR